MRKALVVLTLLVIILPTLSLAKGEDKTDILFDVTKEMDAKYGNPNVQDRFLTALDEAQITYEFTPENVTLDELLLDDYKILVIWDPEGTYSEAEKLAIYEFVEDGGNLIFLGTSFFDTVNVIFDDLNNLLSPYNIQLTKERMIDLTDYFGCKCGTTPIVSNFAENSYFYNVDSIALRHTCRLEVSSPAYAIAMGDDDAYIDLNFNEVHDEGELMGDIPVIAQRDVENGGTIVVFGSEKVFGNTSLNLSDNKKFAINLFSDLASDYDARSVDDGSSMLYYILGGIVALVLVATAVFLRKRK